MWQHASRAGAGHADEGFSHHIGAINEWILALTQDNPAQG
jgi:hypothetical protein